MHVRAALIAAAAWFATAPALAVLAPEYYEAARRDADSVIVVAVERVDSISGAPGYGYCTVHGDVAGVERGSRYQVGQQVALRVPCRRANAQIPAGPVLWKNVSVLQQAPFGRAFLTPAGEIALSQYDLLASYP